MTRNQKIALGCGGAGCLGLIVAGIAGMLIYYFAYRTTPSRDSNFNISTNRNSNSNDDSDITANQNDDEDDNDNSANSSSSSSTSVSSMSDDDKHKLYQAALVTGDDELIRRVSVKLGLMNDDFTPGDEMTQFVASHALWMFNNRDFVQSVNTAEKGRKYVDENFPN